MKGDAFFAPSGRFQRRGCGVGFPSVTPPYAEPPEITHRVGERSEPHHDAGPAGSKDRTRPHALGRVTPRWPWYLPPRSA